MRFAEATPELVVQFVEAVQQRVNARTAKVSVILDISPLISSTE